MLSYTHVGAAVSGSVPPHLYHCISMTSQQGHIIFVDDDEEDHLIMSEYFREAGKGDCITFIKNGQEALNYLNEITDHATLPSLIVLDLNMPILNDTQTLALLKGDARYRKIPVLIFSTSENENEKRKCLSLGAREYIVKPTTYLDGFEVVEKFAGYLHI